MRAIQMTVTPAQARQWLAASNTTNRSLSKMLLAQMVKDLLAGKWRLNGETIIFDSASNILDGHHRLTACAESGVAIETFVVLGADPSALVTIDTGKTRDSTDALTFAGESNAGALAAAARLVWLAEAGSLDESGRGARRAGLTREELLNTVARHPGLRDAASGCTAYYRQFPQLPRSLWAFMRYWFARYDAARAASFVEALASGAGLEKDDAVFLLRSRLIQNANMKAKLPLKEVLALAIKAWVHHARGEKLRSLRWLADGNRAEAFPDPDPGALPDAA